MHLEYLFKRYLYNQDGDIRRDLLTKMNNLWVVNSNDDWNRGRFSLYFTTRFQLMVPIVSPCPEGLEYVWQRGVESVFFDTSYFLSHNPCWGYHLWPRGIYSFALLRTQYWCQQPSTITCLPHSKRYTEGFQGYPRSWSCVNGMASSSYQSHTFHICGRQNILNVFFNHFSE